MKNSPINNQGPFFKIGTYRKNKGFALISTISIMALLLLLALSMMSLSTVEVRASQNKRAMEEAQANARMALMMAIGELQQSMGPDTRVSATSEILATSATSDPNIFNIAKPNTVGIWESWDYDPNSASPLDYDGEKTARFKKWLVSSENVTESESLDFVKSAWSGNTIELVGGRSILGAGASEADALNVPDAYKVNAGLIPVSKDGVVQGSYAWHVADESVKARINLYRDPSKNTTLAEKRALLAGHRPDTSVMRGLDGDLLTSLPTDRSQTEYATADKSTGKVLDLAQAELLDQAEGKIKQFRHDITPYSMAPITNVRSGGLKQDLSSMFEMGSAANNTLPSEYTNKKLYESTHGITGISDPNWSALAGYYNSFRGLTNPDTSPTLIAKTDSSALIPVPEGYNPAPVIAKVDTIFSMVGRPMQEIWWAHRGGGLDTTTQDKTQPSTAYDYFVDLIYTPVVTLHNPYNVNISFHRLNVKFTNVPVAVNFMFKSGNGGGFRSLGKVSNVFESINTMAYVGGGHVDDHGDAARNNKSFVLNIANWQTDSTIAQNSSISGPIILKPGQTLMCGPTLDPSGSYRQDTRGGSTAFDWRNHLTDTIKAKPQYIPGLGYEIYSTVIGNIVSSPARSPQIMPSTNGGFYEGGWRSHGFMILRDTDADGNPNVKLSDSTVTDEFYLEYKVQQPGWYVTDNSATATKADPTFEVTAQLQAEAGSPVVDFAKLTFDYGDDSKLKSVFDDRTYRYPPTGALTGSEVGAPVGVLYRDQSAYVHPFAIFSATTRTTNAGVYETRNRSKIGLDSPEVNLLRDGRIAGKPYLFHNPSRSNFVMNLANEKPGTHPYELNFQPFLSQGDFQDYMELDPANRTPSLTGNQTTTGIKSGSYLEIPSGPLQTIADFRRSNALTTSYLPHFVQPVSNSSLHPLMSPDKVVESNSNITSTELLDHSVLANHALYDNFYFSTFATQGTTKPDAVFENFMNGTAPLASQAFQPFNSSGKTIAAAKAELFNSGTPNDNAYKNAAEYQMIRGPFNVNSTSVQAWKAVLASMNKSEVATLWARNGGLETKTATGTPFPGMSLVNGGVNSGAIDDPAKIDNERTNDWNGYRELTETELEKLAVKIVAEVRERGPFLSMSEFVNRQIGPESPLTLSGALEAAIDKSEINEPQNAVFPDTYLDQIPIEAADISNPKLYAYKTPEATTGNPAAGAPGWVNQGDLMRILEPSATVRGDTFVIRVYGDAQDANGKIIARAYAEAVVQRTPEYVDPVDRPSVNASEAGTSATTANQTYGRRMQMVSFRWLSEKEI